MYKKATILLTGFKMIDIIKSNELCLSDFGVQKVLTQQFMSYDAGNGKKESSFGFMVQGNGIFSSAFGNLEVNEGDLIYIPEGARYRSLSKGSPFVEYYCVHVSFRNDPASGRVDRRFGMQKIDTLSTPETGAVFAEMYELVRTGTMVSRARALHLFYGFFAEAAKHLKEAERPACSPCVDRALAYIEEHFREDYSTADLAKHCLVSGTHSDLCLTKANISAQKSVHGTTLFHILFKLFHTAKLIFCFFIRKNIFKSVLPR